MIEFKTVASKIPSTLYARLIQYCKKEGISTSTLIKNLVEAEVSGVVPYNKAGNNLLEYDKVHDVFNWSIQYDDGSKIEIARNINKEFLIDLLKTANSELNARELYLKKSKQKSVAAPTKIKKVVSNVSS